MNYLKRFLAVVAIMAAIIGGIVLLTLGMRALFYWNPLAPLGAMFLLVCALVAAMPCDGFGPDDTGPL